MKRACRAGDIAVHVEMLEPITLDQFDLTTPIEPVPRRLAGRSLDFVKLAVTKSGG